MTAQTGPILVNDHYLWRRWTNIRTDVIHRNVACDWDKNDFWHFVDYIEHTIGPQPQLGMKLIRKTVHKGWVKKNMMWADYIEAGRHYSTCRIYKIGRKEDTVSGWARTHNISPATVFSRLELGWTIKRALGLTK